MTTNSPFSFSNFLNSFIPKKNKTNSNSALVPPTMPRFSMNKPNISKYNMSTLNGPVNAPPPVINKINPNNYNEISNLFKKNLSNKTFSKPVTAPLIAKSPVDTNINNNQFSAPIVTPQITQPVVNNANLIDTTTQTLPNTPATVSAQSSLQKAVSKAQSIFTNAQKISPEQLSTQKDLDRLIESTKKAYLNTSGQAIPLEFITGQLKSIENRSLGLAEPLESKLARLQATRKSSLESSKFALERADQKLTNVKQPTGFTLSKDQQRYDASGKLVAQNTGDNISGVQQSYNPNVSGGEDFLKTLSPQDASLVKGVANYKLNIARISSLRSSAREKLMKMVMQYDPTFDMTQYGTRESLRKDFTSGKSSQSIRSLNTAVGHLQSLSESFKNLDNSSIPIWNAIRNFGISETGGGEITSVKNNINAVAGEMATVFKNSSGTDQEIKAWKDEMSASQSPEQVKAGIEKMIELMGSRLSAFKSQWKSGMGRPIDFKILSDKSKKILSSMGVNVNSIDPSNQAKGTSSGSDVFAEQW